jgi:hypothetical protein
MLNRLSVFALLLILVSASSALAVDPAPGVYNSSPVPNAPFPEGRGSQSNELPADAQNGLDDVFNTASWDGVALGAQWMFSCGVAPVAHTVINNVDGNGNGTITYINTFTGGTFFLWKDGPWGDGVNDLTGTMNTTSSTVLVQVVGGQFAGSVGNVSTSGSFDGSGCVVTFEINNLVGLGDTDLTPPFPANYPALLDTSCGATRVNGSWGDVVDLTLRIDCPVQTEELSWSGIKSMYR